MVFIRYQHVERLDADEAEGLLEGRCHVFPKMDGSNMCAYLEDGGGAHHEQEQGDRPAGAVRGVRSVP